MPYNYALRVDLDGVTRQEVSEWIAAAAACYFIVAETVSGENPHIHAFLTCDSKLPALRKKVQRWLSGDRGNASYSLKLCSEDYADYLTYLCKGDSNSSMPDVVGKCGIEFTDAWVEQQHGLYWVNNEALVRNRHKRKKISSATAVEKLEERCKEAGVLWNQKNEIAMEYIRMCKAGRKAINVFSARSIVNAVTVALCPDDTAAKELAQLIAPAECFNF